MLWYSKEQSQWDGSFEHQKQMLKLMDIKKIQCHTKYGVKSSFSG